jgi:predicted flap endonuclease-1-like 5' DNA nuclease
MPTITDIEGIGEKFAEKLRSAGVRTTEALLKKGGTSANRKDLAMQIDVSDHQILEWVNRADLYRIKGVGSEYADLLEAAGVDTVRELAKRQAGNLFENLKMINDEKKKVRKLPTADQVAEWVKQAKSLPRAVEY